LISLIHYLIFKEKGKFTDERLFESKIDNSLLDKTANEKFVKIIRELTLVKLSLE